MYYNANGKYLDLVLFKTCSLVEFVYLYKAINMTSFGAQFF